MLKLKILEAQKFRRRMCILEKRNLWAAILALVEVWGMDSLQQICQKNLLCHIGHPMANLLKKNSKLLGR